MRLAPLHYARRPLVEYYEPPFEEDEWPRRLAPSSKLTRQLRWMAAARLPVNVFLFVGWFIVLAACMGAGAGVGLLFDPPPIIDK
jgi:hypothetical protein